MSLDLVMWEMWDYWEASPREGVGRTWLRRARLRICAAVDPKLAEGAQMTRQPEKASRFVIYSISHTCEAGRRQGNLCSPFGRVHRSRSLLSLQSHIRNKPEKVPLSTRK